MHPVRSEGTHPGSGLRHTPHAVLDVLGIGFGPSNLALAIALDEHNRLTCGRALRAVFFEKKPRFGWHRGMLTDDATMQVSFLKDLVTMRNPTSDFTFISYLHSQGRLIDFINHKIFFPLRIEFHDYLEWAASRMDDLVEYNSEVIDVRPVRDGDVVAYFDVVVRRAGCSEQITVWRARNVVVAVGLEMSLPPAARLDDRVWHNLDLVVRADALPATSPCRFIVLGAGQSAAEATEYLHRRFPEAEVCSTFSRYGYTLADDSPFANRIFDPEAVDVYFGAPKHVKRMLFDYHRNTNYSVVDQELIEELYRRVYQEKVQGRQRLRILNASRVVDVVTSPDGVAVTVEYMPTGERTVLACDVLVYATGYRPVDALRLLGEAGRLCLRDDEGMVCVERDYRVTTTAPTLGGIYLQGGTEHIHGITSTLLSNIAVRSGEILQSIVERAGIDRTPQDAVALFSDYA
jgi:L-ornithine N5-monooxygenase